MWRFLLMQSQEFIDEIVKGLSKVENIKKPDEVKKVLYSLFEDKEIRTIRDEKPNTNWEALALFISAKRVEGCSEASIHYYENTLKVLLLSLNKTYFMVTTDDIRNYLSSYKENKNISKVTEDNVRRIISSFFSWLESEDYIVKSPCRRIHKVKTGKVVKETYSDESLELMRQNCSCLRDLVIIDFLFSTGVRVGELVKLNKADINYEQRECIVLGKGNKQRKVYFDAKTKIQIEQYLALRKDDNEALFVSELAPYKRLEISGIEIMLRKIGKKIGVNKVHPHKFRRTMATKAIDKGMPIEQVQHLLGHSKIDTTLEYAMVDEENVKISHKKYLE
jgi:integrase/recombinase XerD